MTSPLRTILDARDPRSYGGRPTPLHRLDRFSAAIGREVWIKRDDLISVGVGGNKIRKLGFLVADALARGADHLVTVGAEQSNHARCVAAVAAMEGLGCDLILGGRPDTPVVGNLLLDHLLGATVHFPGTDDWATLEAESGVVAERLRAAGKRPYVMPIGGSTPIGALGFVDAYLELRGQLDAAGIEPSAIVHATSSGGTQAGLVVAAALTAADVAVVGVGVAKTSRRLEREIEEIAAGALDLLDAPDRADSIGQGNTARRGSAASRGSASGRGSAVGRGDAEGRVDVNDRADVDDRTRADERGDEAGLASPGEMLSRARAEVGDRISVLDGYRGPAYAEPTAGSTEALLLLARTEGILVDPVYTAKALHAVVDAPASVLGDGPIVFWHTGGLPAVFAPHQSAHLVRPNESGHGG